MSGQKTYFLGIDIGTESARVALIDFNGEMIASSQESYCMQCPRPGWAQQDPEMWWNTTVNNIRSVLSKIDVHPESIAAIGSAGQMHAPVPIDGTGQLLSNEVLLWCDKRSDPQCNNFKYQLNDMNSLKITGNPIIPAWTGFKMRWLKENSTDIYFRTDKFLSCNGYINYRLTGEIYSDFSEASGSYLFDVDLNGWSHDLCDVMGIEVNKLPQIVNSSQVIGKVTPEAASITGLIPGTPVVAGGGDMMCLLLGAGVATLGMACDIGGTACDISVFAPKPLYDERLMHLHHVAPGGWISFGILDSGAFKWFKDELCVSQVNEAKLKGLSAYDFLTGMAAEVPAGAEGLLFLPYLLGERTLGTSASRAVFFGLTPRHGIAQCTRAILEGIVYDLRQSLDIISSTGIRIEGIRSVGGSAESMLWNQIKADIYKNRLITLSNFEGGIMGTAILAAVGSGYYKDIQTAVERMIRIKNTYEPNVKTMERYNRFYAIFKELHDGLQPYFTRLAKTVVDDNCERMS